MSFVRLGENGSQVYIYDDVDRGPTCCYCAFTKRLPDRTDAELAELWIPFGLAREHYRQRSEPDFSTRDLGEMLEHVARHRAAGHVVPDWVDQVLRDEWDAE
jgi:glutaredoxin